MILLSWDVIKGDLIEILSQFHNMFSIRNQVGVACFLIPVDLTNHQSRISINREIFNPLINGSLNTIYASLVFSHIISTIKTNPGREWNMETCRRSKHSPNTITQCIRSTVEHERPSRPWFGSFLLILTLGGLSHTHYILIRKLKVHRLVIIHGLMREIIGNYTTFNGLLSSVLYVIFCQDHLPTGNPPGQCWFLKYIFDWVHP